MDSHPLRHIWRKMISRCHDPESDSYSYYGARGIKVCARWRRSFQKFVEDVGPRPSLSHTLDRYPDNDGDYRPGNIRWATRAEQQANTRRNRIVIVKGERLHVAEAARRYGVKDYVIWWRLEAGWTDEAAVLTSTEKRISLSDKQRVEIRAMKGRSQGEIAILFGVCQKTVSNILKA